MLQRNDPCHQDKLIYCAIVRLSTEEHTPGIGEIAADLGITPRDVTAGIKRLEQTGHLTCQKDAGHPLAYYYAKEPALSGVVALSEVLDDVVAAKEPEEWQGGGADWLLVNESGETVGVLIRLG